MCSDLGYLMCSRHLYRSRADTNIISYKYIFQSDNWNDVTYATSKFMNCLFSAEIPRWNDYVESDNIEYDHVVYDNVDYDNIEYDNVNSDNIEYDYVD